MDHCASVLLSFPAPDIRGRRNENELFDQALKQHVGNLEVLFKQHGDAIFANAVPLLECLDPALNSLSYLAILDFVAPTNTGPHDVEDAIVDKIVTFLLTFDARQIRIVGSTFSSIFGLVATGQLVPHAIAVDILSKALLRIDPSSAMLTSNHISLVKLAYHTDNIVPALPVISQRILYYPGMANQTEAKRLGDPDLPPPAYITRHTGLTVNLKSAQVLEYDYIVGLMHCSQRDWASACAAFERVVAYPTRDGGVSKIMTEAHKKWILTGLLLSGKTAAAPPHTGPVAAKSCGLLSKSYMAVAESFDTLDAAALRTAIEAGLDDFLADGNDGLLREVRASHQKWQIASLRNVYAKISLSQIRTITRSAETGEMLASEDAVAALIQDMLAAGMLHGSVIHPADGNRPAHLEFAPAAAEELSEQAYAAELAAAAARLAALQPVFRATHERMATSRDYARHVLREEKRDPNNGRGLPAGAMSGLSDWAAYDDPLEDEDLMTGVVTGGN